MYWFRVSWGKIILKMSHLEIIHEFRIKSNIQDAFDAFTTEKGKLMAGGQKNAVPPNKVGEIIKVSFTEHNVEMDFKIELRFILVFVYVFLTLHYLYTLLSEVCFSENRFTTMAQGIINSDRYQ